MLCYNLSGCKGMLRIAFSSMVLLTCFQHTSIITLLECAIAKASFVYPSVRLSVTRMSHGYTVQDIEMHFAALL